MICSAAAAARITVCSEHMEMLPAAAEACLYDTLTGIPGDLYASTAGVLKISEKNIEKIFANVSYNLYICIAIKTRTKLIETITKMATKNTEKLIASIRKKAEARDNNVQSIHDEKARALKEEVQKLVSMLEEDSRLQNLVEVAQALVDNRFDIPPRYVSGSWNFDTGLIISGRSGANGKFEYGKVSGVGILGPTYTVDRLAAELVGKDKVKIYFIIDMFSSVVDKGRADLSTDEGIQSMEMMINASHLLDNATAGPIDYVYEKVTKMMLQFNNLYFGLMEYADGI